MKPVFLVLCAALLLYSCSNNDNDQTTNPAEPESAEPYFRPDFDYVQQTPDSLRTPEQKELVEKLQAVLTKENLKVIDSQLVFTLSKEEFVARGIPEEYYELIEKDMVNNNKFLKENKVDIDSLMKDF